jgi:hypothetical protein
MNEDTFRERKQVASAQLQRSPILWFALILSFIAVFTGLGPVERTLGVNVRVVYLHGAWVWAALAAFLVAGLVGLVGLIIRCQTYHCWSRALGRTGLFFWITYLPISMWAMQTSWNGLFLAEPRWRLAVVFAVGGLPLQLGLTLMEDPVWASGANLVYALALIFALRNAQNVMHPPAPILDSNALRIQLYFAVLLLLALLGAWQIARWWRQFECLLADSTTN